MSDISLTIDGVECACKEGDSILQAALASGIYVPNLCHHPDLTTPDKTRRTAAVHRGDESFAGESGEGEPWEGCGLCLVDVTGSDEPVRACVTWARDGMEVETSSERVKELRRRNLSALLATHPHACLSCAEREGCTRITCSLNVPVEERCCPLLGKCELQKVADYVGIPEYTPRYTYRDRPVLKNEPLFSIDYNLCIACGRCVRACNDLRGVMALGTAKVEGETIVGHMAAGGLEESECRFCGACVEVCPTGALRDKVETSGAREDWLVPCRSTCPAGVDVPQYIRFISQGRYDEATGVVRERAPLPLTLGSACFHPCETVCRRSELDDPIAICSLKRFAAERESAPPEPPSPEPSGKKVAVVGSGPAGLSCAWYLARKGHAVEVLEAGDEPGGMMTQAIPEFRLPKSTVLREIEHLAEHNIRIKTSTPVEVENPADLLQRGFDAVFIAVGNAEAKRIDVPGIEGPGVHWGLDLLREVKAGERPSIGERIIVIGGGNVAVDAALTAVRIGGREIHMVCLEKPDEMPAHGPELEQAVSEGVTVHNSWGPAEVLRENGEVTGVHFVRCTRVFDNSGRFDPKFDEGETFSLEADTIVLAIGQALGDPFADSPLKDAGDRLAADHSTCATAFEGVYAGGEATRGPLSIIGAVQEGRKAAAAMDLFLGGDGRLHDDRSIEPEPAIGRDDGFARRERREPAPPRPEGGHGSFAQIAGVYTEEEARYEAGRCLQCDLRLQISSVLPPPKTEKLKALDEENLSAVPPTAGVYRLVDSGGEVFRISGTSNLKDALEAELEKGMESVRYEIEENPMYSQRESELIQQYLQQHGKMPGGGGDDDLDDLF